MKVNKLDSNLVCVGSIGKSRGLVGEFFLNSFCDPQDNILNYTSILIEGHEDLQIDYIKKFNNKFLSKIRSIDNIDLLKGYTNLKLFINKSELPRLEENDFLLARSHRYACCRL
jgi:16S rRNA processing protein RimM